MTDKMTAGELVAKLQLLNPGLPVYVSDSRNGETNRVRAAFEEDNEGNDAGDILYEEAPRVVILSVG